MHHTTDDLKWIVREEYKKRKDIAQQFDHRWTTNLIQTPFNRRIADTNLPSRLTAPKFDLNEGTIDPMVHLIVY